MKHYYLLLLIVIITIQGYTQDREEIKLWANKVPGEVEKKEAPTYKYNDRFNVNQIVKVTDPAFTVYRPEQANGTAVIICPGGGYRALSMDLEGSEIASWLNSLGITAFVLEYRVPDKRKGALQDLQRAIRLVRDKAKTWEINPDQIGVLGFSAGADLCARASTQYTKNTYDHVDLADSISTQPDFTILVYPAYLDNIKNKKLLRSDLLVNESTNPMFVFATGDDKYCNSAIVIAQALIDAKVPTELHILPEGGHGYGIRKGNNAGETWPQLAEKWLSNSIKP